MEVSLAASLILRGETDGLNACGPLSRLAPTEQVAPILGPGEDWMAEYVSGLLCRGAHPRRDF
jgi:hypothetical protein